MKRLQFKVAALCGLLLFSSVAPAQKPRPKARPAVVKPGAPTPPANTATATPTDAPTNAAPQTAAPSGPQLATVNGQKIYASDLGPDVVQALTTENQQLAALRSDALEKLVNTYLLEAEAAKRKITLDALLNTEINSKITEPTEAQTTTFYDANRAQMQGQNYVAVRPQIVNFLKQQQAQQLEGALAKRLRAASPVTLGADVNAPNLAPDAVVATAAGKTITARQFNDRVAPVVYSQRIKLWDAAMDVLDVKINDLLLLAEAKKRGVTPDQLLQKEVSEKLTAPTDAQINKFYNDNKANIPAPLEQSRGQISDYLMQQQRQQLEQGLVQQLRTPEAVQILLPEPEPPVLNVSVDDDPARGPANAPVTIVVFTDFQCPSCAQAHPVLDAVMTEFGDKVRLVARDFPLEKHKDARKAAEAANAANAQGKFFDYINILYKNQDKLDVASLKGYALALGLDRAKFDAELDSGKYAAEVEHDVQDGVEYSIAGTPTIFINGVRLENLSSDAMRAAIQAALKKAGATK